MTKADIFLSIRNKSTRLPEKSFLKIKDKTVTEHLIDRLKKASNISQIILCTSTNTKDDIFKEIAKQNNIRIFRGSEDDKLKRYRDASRKFNTELAVIVDGDDIFCEPEFIENCVKSFEKEKSDFVSIKNAPLGTVPFCVKKEALEKICDIKKDENTEVWGAYFTETDFFTKKIIDCEKAHSIDLKLGSPLTIMMILNY